MKNRLSRLISFHRESNRRVLPFLKWRALYFDVVFYCLTWQHQKSSLRIRLFIATKIFYCYSGRVFCSKYQITQLNVCCHAFHFVQWFLLRVALAEKTSWKSKINLTDFSLFIWCNVKYFSTKQKYKIIFNFQKF